MKKVCRDWPKEAFGSGLVDECYYDEFEKNATTAAAKVFKVKDFAEGEVKLQEILKNLVLPASMMTRFCQPRRF